MSIPAVGAGLTELLHLYSPSCSLRSATDTWIFHSPVIIIMYIYHVLINALSAHMIHSNLNTIILYTCRAQFYQNNLHKVLYGITHMHTHMHTRTYTHTHTTHNTHNTHNTHTHTHTHTHRVTVAETGF